MNRRSSNSRTENDSWWSRPRNMILTASSAFLVIFSLAVAFNSYFVVDSGYHAILTQFGQVDDEVYGPGFHTKWPWKGVENFRTATSTLRLPATEAATGRGQVVRVVPVLRYSVNPTTLPEIRRRHRFESWEERIVQPEIVGVLKNRIAQYLQMERVLQERTLLGEAARQDLTAIVYYRLSTGGDVAERVGRTETSWEYVQQTYVSDPSIVPMVVVEAFIIEDLDPDRRFRDAVEEKQAAEQQVQTSEFNRQRMELEGKGQADRAAAVADGEARRISLIAEANAQALQVLADKWSSFGSDVRSAILQQMMIERWDQRLPEVWAGNNSPLNWYRGSDGQGGVILPLQQQSQPEDTSQTAPYSGD